jgi:alpha-galactosidase
VEEVCKACPQAIFDFDITEGERFVGLGFLSAGKFFHMNNGPY